ETAAVLRELADRLANLAWICEGDVAHLARRAEVFIERLDDGKTVFSHKVGLWPDSAQDPMLPAEVAPSHYALSLHVMTPSVLDHILMAATPRVLRETAGSRRSVR